MASKVTKKPAKRTAKTVKPAPKASKKPEEETMEPPRTTTGKWFTAPKFGSAGSGGAELEPGPEKD